MSFETPEVTEREWDSLWNVVLQRVEEPGEKDSSSVGMRPFPRGGLRARYVLVAAAAFVLVAGAALRIVLSEGQNRQTPIASYIQYHEDAVDGHVLLENHFWNAQVLPVTYTAGNYHK